MERSVPEPPSPNLSPAPGILAVIGQADKAPATSVGPVTQEANLGRLNAEHTQTNTAKLQLTWFDKAPSANRVTENRMDPSTSSPATHTWADLLRGDKDKNARAQTAPLLSAARETRSNNNITHINDIIFPYTDGLQLEPATNLEEADKFYFYGEEGFDSIIIESKVFRFGIRNNEIAIFEIKKSQLHKISFNLELAPQIIRYIYQLTGQRQLKRFGSISVYSNFNKAGGFIKIAKEKGTFILIPAGPQKARLHEFLGVFSNFVGIFDLVQEEPMHQLQEVTGFTEEPTSISKLIFDSQIRGAFPKQQWSPTLVEHPRLVEAYSDASDNFYQSDDSFYMDDFLGHATESDRRPPISTPTEIGKSKFNRAICTKSKFVTSENCLPTENLNTQLKIYRKSQKNKRRHSMTTRSQTREFPWV
ncbi:unnamed protein product [Cuscuta epithymum]|uniref:Uncharacterized protein n=1 Tax=Cuscuta epithymum TaxID=186058 RepID=A0AAV0C2W2_9ASTE|nr:unnamed protein product [Cuscuta epithymum]